MKRVLLLVALIFMIGSYAMAGSGQSVVIKGDKKFLKTAEGIAMFELVFDDATYDYKRPLTEQFSNLNELKAAMYNGFIKEFNNRNKKVKVTSSNDSAKYKFAMKVKNMDQYFKVMGFIPGPATKVWGTFTVTDLDTNETIAVIDIIEVDGGANLSPQGTFVDCFEELAKQISKMK